MDTYKIRVFHPTITRCELRLEHSSRQAEPYWLEAQLYLYAGDERKKILFLGSGSKQDSAEVIRLITDQDFVQTGARLNQEWEHIGFARSSAEENPEISQNE
jgi:hypothetical protein